MGKEADITARSDMQIGLSKLMDKRFPLLEFTVENPVANRYSVSIIMICLVYNSCFSLSPLL